MEPKEPKTHWLNTGRPSDLLCGPQKLAHHKITEEPPTCGRCLAVRERQIRLARDEALRVRAREVLGERGFEPTSINRCDATPYRAGSGGYWVPVAIFVKDV